MHDLDLGPVILWLWLQLPLSGQQHLLLWLWPGDVTDRAGGAAGRNFFYLFLIVRAKESAHELLELIRIEPIVAQDAPQVGGEFLGRLIAILDVARERTHDDGVELGWTTPVERTRR